MIDIFDGLIKKYQYSTYPQFKEISIKPKIHNFKMYLKARKKYLPYFDLNGCQKIN